MRDLIPGVLGMTGLLLVWIALQMTKQELRELKFQAVAKGYAEIVSGELRWKESK